MGKEHEESQIKKENQIQLFSPASAHVAALHLSAAWSGGGEHAEKSPALLQSRVTIQPC